MRRVTGPRVGVTSAWGKGVLVGVTPAVGVGFTPEDGNSPQPVRNKSQRIRKTGSFFICTALALMASYASSTGFCSSSRSSLTAFWRSFASTISDGAWM